MTNKLSLSFEIFPPQNLTQKAALDKTFKELEGFEPSFWSLTYGASGADQGKSTQTLKRLVAERKGPLCAHITAAGQSKEEVLTRLAQWKELGIKKLVVLRGDGRPAGFEAHPQGYQSSLDLLEDITRWGGFETSVAAYPERHPESRSEAADFDYLKRKQDAGATSAITQFFFDPAAFLSFREKAVAAGVTLDLIPGILPIRNFEQVERFAKACGATLPPSLTRKFKATETRTEAEVLAEESAINLCLELLSEGVEALHFYTLNNPTLTARTLYRLGHYLADRPRALRPIEGGAELLWVSP